jgi:hypothetical protein
VPSLNHSNPRNKSLLEACLPAFQPGDLSPRNAPRLSNSLGLEEAGRCKLSESSQRPSYCLPNYIVLPPSVPSPRHGPLHPPPPLRLPVLLTPSKARLPSSSQLCLKRRRQLAADAAAAAEGLGLESPISVLTSAQQRGGSPGRRTGMNDILYCLNHIIAVGMICEPEIMHDVIAFAIK